MTDRLFVVLFLLCGAAFAIAFYSIADREFLWLLAGLGVGQVVGVVCHEVGHAACAMAGSIKVQRIQIGSGRIIVRRRIGETWIELRLDCLWGGGGTAVYQPLIFHKYRSVLFILGGALGNVALLALLALIGSMPWPAAVFADLRWGLAAAAFSQVVMIARSLIPSGRIEDGKRIENDGRLILNMLRTTGSAPTRHGLVFATMLRRYCGGQDPQLTASPAASRICFHITRPDRRTGDVGRETDDALLRELARGNLTREEEMLVLDALMTDAMLYRDPALLARLDEWSLRALELGPTIETLRGTRGAALVERGHYAEAKALLEPLIAADPGSFDSVLSCAFLARAEHALGNSAAARRLATNAQTIFNTNHSLWPSIKSFIDRVAAEVHASPST